MVRKALSWPARQIALNAGEDGSVVIGKILAACRTEVYSMIANDSFVGANVHRTRDRAQSALLRSPIELASRCLGCI
jgi:chaperonin GroEL (HSP60 family)